MSNVMTVGELKELLDGYGDHLVVMATTPGDGDYDQGFGIVDVTDPDAENTRGFPKGVDESDVVTILVEVLR